MQVISIGLKGQVFKHKTVTKPLTNKQLKERIYGKKPTDFFNRTRTVNINQCANEIPRDRDSSFAPQIIPKRNWYWKK